MTLVIIQLYNLIILPNSEQTVNNFISFSETDLIDSLKPLAVQAS